MKDKVITDLLQRLARLESYNSVRHCITRYMAICDDLDVNTDLDELMDLFTLDCIWEGVGERYSKTFGRYDTWQAVYDMFKRYTQKESHFTMNAHFLTSEQITVTGQQAYGTWLMLQASSFKDGRSHLNAAKISVTFKQQPDEQWKIQWFQTENIFSTPVPHWHSDIPLPLPNQA